MNNYFQLPVNAKLWSQWQERTGQEFPIQEMVDCLAGQILHEVEYDYDDKAMIVSPRNNCNEIVSRQRNLSQKETVTAHKILAQMMRKGVRLEAPPFTTRKLDFEHHCEIAKLLNLSGWHRKYTHLAFMDVSIIGSNKPIDKWRCHERYIPVMQYVWVLQEQSEKNPPYNERLGRYRG